MKRKRAGGAEGSACSSVKSVKVTAEGRPARKAAPPGYEELWQCLGYLQDQFPVDCFQTEPPLPQVVLQHQFYSLLSDRTSVDRDLMALRDAGELRIFQIGVAGVDYAVVESDHYMSYLRQYFERKGCLVKYQHFMKHILPACADVSVSEKQLRSELKVTESQISDLVRSGILVVRAVGASSGRSWWFSIPGLSPFTRGLSQGRRQLKQWLQRARCNEMLQTDLESRKWRASALSLHYHLHDLVGADVVERIETTSGPLIRLIQETTR